MSKIFPIKTATACQLKWTWSTIFLNDGTTSSCHRVGRHPFALDNFEDFHNTPEKIAQRETMLQGQWPQPLPYMTKDEGCRYCQKIEEAGGHSDRIFHTDIPDLSPPELDLDPTATKVTPRILEVFLNNTCNLSCTYCSAYNSSLIEQENKKWGTFEKNGLKLNAITIDRNLNGQYIEKFFSWIESNSNVLRRLHLLGGEPLYQKEFYRCLDFFVVNPNPNLEFNLVTNLMISGTKLQSVVDKWESMLVNRCVKRIDVTVSLDCWGPEQEYARHGLRLDQIEANMEILLEKSWLYLNINSTLSPLTIRTFPELVSKINQWKTRHKLNHHFQTVFAPEHHSPDIFGPDLWSNDFERALSLMPETNWQESHAKNYLSGIYKQIQNSCKNPKMIVKLLTHLDELDRRRGTDWKKLFPYLENWRDHVV
jgi:MoaA/NifB/PqqE/SkfB family radical SAM enzyme